MRIRLISLLLLLPYAAVFAAASNCTSRETVIFSCAVGKGGELVSVCASPLLTANSGTLYYRYGRPSDIELEYPVTPNGAARKFKHAHYSRSQVDRVELSFSIGSYKYGVFDYFEDSESPKYRRGVVVSTEGSKPQETTLQCKGPITSKLYQLEGKVPCDVESALAQCGKSE